MLFEKRIRETERQIESQNTIENRIDKLEKEIKKNSFDSFIKNNQLEKRTQELQNKIQTEDLQSKLADLEKLQEEVNIKSTEFSDSDINIEKKTSELVNRIASITPKEDAKQKEIEPDKIDSSKKINEHENETKKFFFWSSERKQTNEPDTGELVKQYFKKKSKPKVEAKVNIGNNYKTKEWDLRPETLDKEIQKTKKIENN